jgi:PAS domain S-box-containing protein
MITKLPLRDEKGNIIGLVGAARDVTEQMRLEKELAYERNLFKNLMDNLPVAVYFKDREGRLIRVCKEYEKFHPDAIGKTDFDLYPEEAAREAAEEEKRIIETGEAIVNREGRTIFEGSEHYWLTTKAPVYDEEGKVMGIVGITTDITERKRMEEALRASEEKYRSLVESSGDSIYMLSKDLRYLSANKALCSRLGVSSESEIVGRPYGDFHSPAETRELSEIVKGVFETGEVAYQEHEGRVPGTWFLRTLSPYRDPRTGEVVAVTVISKDITELKRVEEGRARLLAEQIRAKEAEKLTKELQARVEELEKLHRLTVGRELKMIQLEEEIKELRKKLGMKEKKKQK